MFYLSHHRHRCHNFQYFGQLIEPAGKEKSLVLQVDEMDPDPEKWCRSDGSGSTTLFTIIITIQRANLIYFFYFRPISFFCGSSSFFFLSCSQSHLAIYSSACAPS
jgi:hypothetical protein